MTHTISIVERVATGAPAELVPGKRSAIRKEAVDGRVALSRTGLAGDAQVDPNHGGPDKALLHYAAEHYRMWAERYSATRTVIYPRGAADGAGDGGPLPGKTLFGENLLTLGMTEATVCLADRYRIGDTVLVEVTQPRQPCWKLGVTAGEREVPALMQLTAATGWYYRVLETGTIGAGDAIELVERPLAEWSLARILAGFYGTPDDRAFLESLAALRELSGEFRGVVERRLETGRVESWTRRLYGRVGR